MIETGPCSQKPAPPCSLVPSPHTFPGCSSVLLPLEHPVPSGLCAHEHVHRHTMPHRHFSNLVHSKASSRNCLLLLSTIPRLVQPLPIIPPNCFCQGSQSLPRTTTQSSPPQDYLSVTSFNITQPDMVEVTASLSSLTPHPPAFCGPQSCPVSLTSSTSRRAPTLSLGLSSLPQAHPTQGLKV